MQLFKFLYFFLIKHALNINNSRMILTIEIFTVLKQFYIELSKL